MKLKNQNENLHTKLKWRQGVPDPTINRITYLCFVFIFKLYDLETTQQLETIITSEDAPYPIELCKFLEQHDVPYILKFKYDKQQSIQDNFLLWQHIRGLNKRCH